MKQPCPSCGKQVNFEKNGWVCPKCGAVFTQRTADIRTSSEIDTPITPPESVQDSPRDVTPQPQPHAQRPRQTRRRSLWMGLLTTVMFLVVVVRGVGRILEANDVELPQIGFSRDETDSRDEAHNIQSPLSTLEVSVEFPEISMPDPFELIDADCGETLVLGDFDVVIHGVCEARTLAGFPEEVTAELENRLVAVQYQAIPRSEDAGSGVSGSVMLNALDISYLAQLPTLLSGSQDAQQDVLEQLGVTTTLESNGDILIFSVPEDVEIGDMTLELLVHGMGDDALTIVQIPLKEITF